MNRTYRNSRASGPQNCFMRFMSTIGIKTLSPLPILRKFSVSLMRARGVGSLDGVVRLALLIDIRLSER